MMRYFKPSVFIISLIPFSYLVVLIITEALGPDPVQVVVHFTGIWALRFLWLSLAISPLKKWKPLKPLSRVRRMLGLFTFFYTTLHLLVVATLILGWDIRLLSEELVERPYISVGFAAWLILLALAATSFDRMMQWMGKNWRRLHRMVYVAAVLACLHFIWLVRSDIFEPLIYGVVLVFLLGWRLFETWTKKTNRNRRAIPRCSPQKTA